MIHGHLAQHDLVEFLAHSPALAQAFAAVRALGSNPPEGITELDGRRMYVNVHGYTTRHRADCTWESHRRTADLQLVLAGRELIDWTPATPAAAAVAYDSTKDFETWPATVTADTTLRLGAGAFAVFLPGELHRPMIADGDAAPLRKLVVKINESWLRRR